MKTPPGVRSPKLSPFDLMFCRTLSNASIFGRIGIVYVFVYMFFFLASSLSSLSFDSLKIIAKSNFVLKSKMKVKILLSGTVSRQPASLAFIIFFSIIISMEGVNMFLKDAFR